MQTLRVACLAACVGLSAAGDPSPGWLTYAAWTAPKGRITMLNTTWTVPADPKDKNAGDSGAPGWWFGIQNTKGNGALIQPILAWGYEGSIWSMFNAVFDWTDQSWHPSETVTVRPGDKLVSSVYATGPRSYTMLITSTATGKSVSTPYTLEHGQKTEETTAYFVLEHEPVTCKAFPAAGEMSFEDVYVEVDGKQVKPEWKGFKGDARTCNGETVIVDPATIKITWDSKDDAASHNTTAVAKGTKWSAAKKQH